MNAGSSISAGRGQQDPPAWIAGLTRGDWRATTVLFILLSGFFLATAAGNLGETDDVYAFAYRAENFPLDRLSDPRLMLYHVVMRLLFVGATALGLDVSALTLMRCVSALCAAASLILVVRIVFADLKLSATAAVLTGAVLASSYGFWRYAAEAEVYVPAIFLILLIFRGLSSGLRDDGEAGAATGLVKLAAWGALSGLTVLFYQPSVIPLFFAFPLLLLYRDRAVHLGAYLFAGGAVVAGGYLIGFLVYWPGPLSLAAFSGFLSQRAGEFIVPPFSLKTVIVSMIRAAFSLGHDLVSVNWIFAFDPVVEIIRKAFSNNVITEEIFLAKRAGFLVYLPIVSLLALVVTSLRMLPAIWPLPIALLRRRQVLVILVWVVINGAIIGRLNPAGLEAWIMVLPPLAMIFAACVIEPCLNRNRRSLIVAFAAILFAHNAFGGMALVFDPAKEYDRVKGSWVIAEAEPEDLVVVTENAGLAESLRYLSAARVVLIGPFDAREVAEGLLQGDLNGIFTRSRGRDFGDEALRDLIKETWRSGGRLIFFERFFEPPRRGRVGEWPGLAVANEFRTKVARVYDAPNVGATYVLAAPIE